MRFLSRVFCALFVAVSVVFGGFGGAFAVEGFCNDKKECAINLCFDLFDTNNEQIGRACVKCGDSENANINEKNNAELYNMLFKEGEKYYGQYKGFYDSQGETVFNGKGVYIYSDLRKCEEITNISGGTFDGESINIPLYMTPKSASSGWPTVDMCEEWNKGFEGKFGYFYDYLNGNSEYAYASQYSCDDLISKAGSDIITGDPNNPCLCECADDDKYIDLNAANSCWFDGEYCDKVCTSEPKPCEPEPMQSYIIDGTWQCCYFYNRNIPESRAEKGCITSVGNWNWFLDTIGYNPTTTGGYVGADGLVHPCPAGSHFDTQTGMCICDNNNEPVDITTGSCEAPAVISYQITLNNNGATTAGTATIYADGSHVYLDSGLTQIMSTSSNGITVPTKTGYTFGGYYENNALTGNQLINANGKITASGTIVGTGLITDSTWYAKWTAKTTAITFDGNGGTIPTDGTTSATATYGSDMPAIQTGNKLPTRAGYTFAGYYDATSGGTKYYNANGSSARTWNKTDAAKTLYARWTANNYEITLYNDNATTAGTTKIYTTHNTNVYLNSGRTQKMSTSSNGITVPAKTGYTFGGYYSGSGGTGTQYIGANGKITTDGIAAGKALTANGTWYAHWEPKTSYVSFAENSPTYNGVSCFSIGPVNGQQQAQMGSSNVLVYSFIATYGENLIPVPGFQVMKMHNNPTCNKYSFDGFYDATAGGTKYYNVNNTPTRTWDKEAKHVVLYAHWTQNPTYTVTLKGADDSTTFDTIFYNSSAGWTDENGNSITNIGTVPAALAVVGYSRRVNGWYTAPNTGGTQIIDADGVIVSNASVSRNTTLYVHGDKYVPVTLDAGNGVFEDVTTLPVRAKYLDACITCSSSQWLRDVDETPPVIVSSSFHITPPAGYTYSGFKDSVGTTVITGTTLPDSRNIQIQGDNNWTAQYTPNTYTVTLNWSGNKSACANAYSGLPSTISATYDSTMPTLSSVPNNSNNNCQFLGFTKLANPYIGSNYDMYYRQTAHPDNSTHTYTTNITAWDQAVNSPTIYALWGVKCAAGQYLDTNRVCQTCPAGSYCPGGVFDPLKTINEQGKFSCPARQSNDFGGDTYAESGTTYVTSDVGASKVTDCYITYLPKDCLEIATADMFTHSTFNGIQNIPKKSEYVKVYALNDGTYPDDPDYIVPGRLFSKPGYKVDLDNTYKDRNGTTQTIDISNWPPTGPKSVYGMYGTSCSACAAGTYSRGTGYMVWHSGTSSPYGQCSQDGCQIGTYSSAGSGTCTPCPAGTTTNSTFSTSSSACVACSNAAGVATWETPSWVLYNSVGASEAQNICEVKTCASGYYKSGNACLPYSVTFNANDGNLSGTSPLYSKYNNANLYTTTALSQTATIPTATKTGHTFAGWYTAASGGSKVYNASRVLQQNVSGYTSNGKWQLSENKTLYALFSPASYTVTYNCGTGTGTAPANGVATYGSYFTPAANTCTKSGYAFAGWAVSGTNDVYANNFTWNYTQNKTLTAQWFEDKFRITTTSLAAGDSVDFMLTAQGTFYVDCGDGGILNNYNNIIVKSGTDANMYNCTYTTSGVKTIKFGGLATDYKDGVPAISFSDGARGNTLDSRTLIAAVSGDMSAVFPYISTNQPDGKQPRFISTFAGASNLTFVDSHLFDNYTTASTGMFVGTFLGTGLTSVPDGLFYNMTNVAPDAFGTTFAGASHISGYIPKNTFLGIIGNAPGAAGLWASTFEDTHLLDKCPVDTRDVDTGYWGNEDVPDNQWGNYAICETANPFTITLNLNTTGATAGSPTTLYMQYEGKGLAAYSDAAHTTPISKITTPTKPGYTFEGFKVGNDTVVDSDGNIDTRLMYEAFYTGNKTANAQWDLGEYTITLNNASATSAGTTKIYTTYNTNVYLNSGHSQVMSTSANGITVPSKTGYTFVGYYSGSGGTGTQYINALGKITQDGIDAGKALTANGIWYAGWTANRYTVSYALNGGSNGTNHPTSGTYNSEFTVDNPTHAHGTFAGWNVSGMDSTTHYYGTSSANTSSTATSWTNSTITSSIKKFKNLRATSGTVTFTAKWTCAAGYTGDDCATATTYSITYKDGSTTMTGLTPTSYTVESEAITLPTPTKTGYTFGGWYENSGLTGTAVTTIPAGSNGNKTFYAKWNTCTYSHATAAAGTSSTCGGTCASYYSNLSCNGTGCSCSATSYSITYKDGSTTITGLTPTSYTVESSAITLPTTTKTGYTFVGWYDNSGLTGTAVTTIPAGSNGNKTFYAKWTANTYTVAYTLNGGSDGTSHPTSATYNSEFTVDNPTHAHGTFAGWNVSGMDSTTHYYGASSANTSSTATSWANSTITSSIKKFKNLRATSGTVTFTAKWTCATGYTGDNCAVATYSITYKDGSTTMTGLTPTTYTIESSAITLPTPTKTGYTFAGWYGNSGLTGTAVTTIPAGSNGNKTFYAKWTATSYSITYKDGSTTMTGLTPTTYTIESSAITLPTPTKTGGYKFDGWYTTSDFSGSAVTSIAQGSTGNKTFYAKWTSMTVSVSDKTLTYTGSAQSCGNVTVSAPSGATIQYAFAGSNDSCSGVTYGAAPTMTNVSESPKIICYKVSATNYSDKTGSYTCTMNKVACGVTLGATSGSTAFGTNKTTTVSTASGCTLSASSSATSVATASISGTTLTMAPAGVGDATITVTATPDGNHTQSTATYALTVTKGTCTVNLSATSDTITYPTASKTFTATSTSGGTLSVSPTATGTNIHATAAISNGTVTVTPRSTGTQTITVTSAATTNYNSCSATYTATVASKTITINSNGGTGTCAGGSITCSYGSSCTAPSWNSSTCAITNGTGSSSKVLTGWNTAANGGGTAVAFGGNASNASILYAVWVVPGCEAGTGVGVTNLNSVSNNAPVCNKTASAGNYCTASTQTGTAGSTSLTTTCSACPTTYPNSTAGTTTENNCYLSTTPGKYITSGNAGTGTQSDCPAGSYCPGNVTIYKGGTHGSSHLTYGGSTTCPAGSYCAAKVSSATACATGSYTSSTGQSSCVACTNGATTSGTGKTSCDATCSNASGVGTNGWETATWSANSVTNLCTIKSAGCAVDNYKNGNACSACPTTYPNSAAGTTTENNCYLSTTPGKYITSGNAGTGTQSDCTNGSYCPGNVTIYKGGTHSSSHLTYGGISACPTLTSGYAYVSGTGWTAITQCKEQMRPTNCYAGYLTKTSDSNGAWGTAVSTLTAKAGYKTSGSGDSATCSACGSGYYSANGNDNTCDACPTKTDNTWTVATTSTTATSYSACYETKPASSVSSYCHNGQLKKTATSANAWGTATSTLTAKQGSILTGTGDSANCAQCTGATYMASANGHSNTSCTACPDQTSGWTRGTGTGWTGYSSCYETRTPANCASGTIKHNASSASEWGSNSVTAALSSNSNYYVNGTSCSACSGLASGFYPNSDGGTGGASQCYTNSISGQYVKTANDSSATDCGSNAKYKAAHTVNYGSTSTCSDVSTGYYTTGGTSATRTGQSICEKGNSCTSGVKTACGTGKYQDTTGQTSCKSCVAAETSSGWAYVTQSGLTAATQCKEYKNAASVSEYCNSGQLQKTASSATAWGNSTITTALQAVAGSIVSGQTCTQCSGAVYSAGGTATECTACPNQTSGWTRGTGTGWSARTQCYETQTPANCASGTVRHNGSSSSNAWASTVTLVTALTANNGYYASSTATSCSACPTLTSGYAYVSGTGWTAITQCKEQMRPTNCYAGYLTKTSDSNGAWGTAVSTLTAKAGYKTSGSGDSATCSACGSGYYSANGNDNTCDACPTKTDNTWTVATTSTTATSYSACYETKPASSVSSYCHNGQLKKTATSANAWGTATSTLTAKQGSILTGTGDSANCAQCTGATYMASANGHSNTSCTACPDQTSGWTRGTGTGWTGYSSCYETRTPANCASGTIKHNASSASEWGSNSVTAALSSNSNYYVNGTSCSACSGLASGFYPNSDGGTGGASQCYTNSISGQYVKTANDSSATDCGSNAKYKAAHTVNYGSTSTCSDVSTGYYTTGGTSATRTGQSICEKGNSCTSGVKTACGTGKYQDTTGQTSCKSCVAAETSSGWAYVTQSGLTAATQCKEYKNAASVSEYCNSGQLQKTASSATAWGNSTITTALQAVAGSIVSGQTCTQCSGAVYSAGGTATECTACPNQTSGWTRGTGTGWSARTQCYETQTPANCASGTVRHNGSSSSNAWASTVTLVTALTANNGYYASSTATSCSACPTLTSGYAYVSGTGWTAITQCKEQMRPTNCYAGYLTKTSDSNGAWGTAVSTLTAKAGYKTSGSGDSATCSACGSGYYSANGNDNTCDACPTKTDNTWTVATTSTTATSYSACYETKPASSVSSYCHNGQLKKTATSASAWGTATSTLTAKQGSILTGTGDSASCAQCTGATYMASADGHSNTSCTACPDQTSGWTRGTGTGWTAVTQCYETKNATDMDSDCSAGVAKKNATNATTWGTANPSTPFQAKPGRIVNGLACDVCPNWSYSAGGTATQCTACIASESGWTKRTGTGWSTYEDCKETKTSTAINSLCYGGVLTKTQSSASAWGDSEITTALTAKKGAYVNGQTCSACSGATYQDTDGSTATSCTACSTLTGVNPTGGTYAGSGNRDAKTTCKYTAPNKTISGCATVTSQQVTYSGTAWPASTYGVTANAGYIIENNNTNSATCSICTGATFSAGGTASSCSNCPSGYTANTDNGKSADTQCQISVTGGHYIGESGQNSSDWGTCVAGTYKAAHTVNYGSTSSCSNCTGRTKYSGEGAASCSTVSSGYYTTGCTNDNNCTGQTQCTGTTYCVNGVQNNCPNATTYKRTTFPSNYYSPTSISSTSVQNKNGRTAVTQCQVLSWIVGPRGTLYEYANYNSSTSKYDNTASYGWSDVNAGYYLTTKSGCGSYAYYHDANVCPEGSYCPGKTRVACNSSNQATVHTTNFGLESCPTSYPNSAEGTTTINNCSLTLTAGNYVPSTGVGGGALQCPANSYCDSTATIYYGGTHSASHLTYGGDTSCSTATSSKYTKSASGSTTINDCYLNLTAGYRVATAGAGQTKCPGTTFSGSTAPIYYGGNVSGRNTTSSCSNCPSGYTANTTTGKSANTQCQISCAGGSYVATAKQSCVNVGSGYYAAAHLVNYNSVTPTTTRKQCSTGLTTIGYGAGADEVGDCGRKMHMGSNVIYLRSTPKTTPAFRVDSDNDGTADLFGNMRESSTPINMSDGASDTFKTNYNNKTYYIYDDSAL